MTTQTEVRAHTATAVHTHPGQDVVVRRDRILALTLMGLLLVLAGGVCLAGSVDDPVPRVSAAASSLAPSSRSACVVAHDDPLAGEAGGARAAGLATVSVRANAATICLAGRFDQPFDRSTVAKWLAEEGFEVRDAAVEPVAVVLAGADPLNADATDFDPVEGTPQYKAAIAHGARVIRLRDIRRRIKL